jgi:hypothetical protein
VILVPQAALHELLRHRHREIAHLTPQVFARLPRLRFELGLGSLDQSLGFGARRLDQLALLVGDFLQSTGPDRLGLSVGGAQTLGILLLLLRRLRPCGLGLLE